jgi:hypothetical protein
LKTAKPPFMISAMVASNCARPASDTPGPSGDILMKPSASPPRTKLSMVPPSRTVCTMPD